MTGYNKEIFGEPKFTPIEIINRLKAEKCFHSTRLAVFPDWFGAAEMFAVCDAGLLTRKHYGPDTYGHTEYFVKQ